MIARILAALALLGALLTALPAGATCVPGRVEVDPRTGTVVVELPRCNPPPTQ